MKCNMDCLNCLFDDCINDSDIISSKERSQSNEIDKEVKNSRRPLYIPTDNCRPYSIIPYDYKKSQAAYFRKKYYYSDIEKSRRKGRENYHLHKDSRKKTAKKYYDKNRDSILNQKKSYYQEHREEILSLRKEKYIPHPKQVIDTPEAQRKRERERERYQAKKEEINRRRREKRRLLHENNKI